ncbi:hypothetical protein DMENIID0001_038960 [Sergentomyia squamirostris]
MPEGCLYVHRNIPTFRKVRPVSMLECPHCPGFVIAPEEYKAHALKHMRYSCPKPGCDYSCYVESRLAEHARKKHGCGSQPRNFLCVVEKRLRRLTMSPRHEKTHSSERDHVCEECGSSFSEKYNLNRHKTLVHLGQREH